MSGKGLTVNPGDKFNDVTIIQEVERAQNGDRRFLCKCFCGNSFETRLKHLRTGGVKSCGCLRPKGKTSTRKRERLYEVWNTMKSRCYNPNFIEYPRYGGKGISVCDEWKCDYKSFRKWAYENGYDENAPRGKCTIDRIDSNGNYEPSNCRWVDFKIQSNNTKRNHLVTYNGETHTIQEWSEITGISYYVLRSRVSKGKPLQEIFYNGNLYNKKRKEKKMHELLD